MHYFNEEKIVNRTRRLGNVLALCALAMCLPLCASAQSFAVRKVRVFDGDRLHTDMTVVVRDGLIYSVRADTTVPPGTEMIDGTGQTLLPGLFDSHTHTEDNDLTQLLAFGVTTVLDMGSVPTWAADRREEQRQGVVTDRADLLSAGWITTAPRGHGTQFWPDMPTITTPEEAAPFVEARLAEGSDFIKLVYQPRDPSRSLDSATMHAVIAETHRRDRLAVVHVHALEYGRTAIQAGADGIVHVFADDVADAAVPHTDGGPWRVRHSDPDDHCSARRRARRGGVGWPPKVLVVSQ